MQLRALVRARLGERAALDDVERLLESPTPHHLYNAACAVAVYSEKAGEPRYVARALELLARAVDCRLSPVGSRRRPRPALPAPITGFRPGTREKTSSLGISLEKAHDFAALNYICSRRAPERPEANGSPMSNDRMYEPTLVPR